MFINEDFKYFKGRKKDIEYLRMDDTGKNRAISSLCKENDVKVECVPLDTPKLNNMVERGFSIRWETTKIFMRQI